MLNNSVKAGKSLPDLYSYLEQVTDYRNTNIFCNRTCYKLSDLLILVVLASMSNFNSQIGCSNFCKVNSLELKECLNLTNLPSTSTFHRLSKSINLTSLSESLRKWLMDCVNSLNCESSLNNSSNISKLNLTAGIDGKYLKGQHREHQTSQQNMLAIVSSFCHEFKICLNWLKMEGKKDSETIKFRELLDDPCIKLITGDCLHCNIKTLSLIEDSNKKYIIGLKGHTPKLFKTITCKIESGSIEKLAESRDDTLKINRMVEIYSFYPDNSLNDWKVCGIATVVKIVRWRKNQLKSKVNKITEKKLNSQKKPKEQKQTNYYVSNVQYDENTHDANFFAKTIRNH
jgi:hypothetical protein